ncbi:hypothetical protein JZ751_023326 [Albula glossodonta]|uniref:Uncharacterized protein n=1 Tax=Albula glossodonta TaxID=121402 RepID=A0A8T2NK91_9TELE|nr:hypothetical protein JZ751_023326 [Albula glossodonta]
MVFDSLEGEGSAMCLTDLYPTIFAMEEGRNPALPCTPLKDRIRVKDRVNAPRPGVFPVRLGVESLGLRSANH